jgi:hypothetical protein
MSLLENVAENFGASFQDSQFPCRKTIHYLVIKPTTGSLVDKKPHRKRTVVAEDKLDEIGAKL